MTEASHVIYDRLFKRIKDKLQQPANMNALKNFYNELYSQNAEALASTIPDKTIYVNAKMEEKFFNIIGVDTREFTLAIKDAPDINNNHQTIVGSTMYVPLVMVAIIFHHLKKDDLRKQTMFICSLYIYRNVRAKYFRYKVTQNHINCMNYTVANLSYKSDLKKYQSIGNMINKKNEVFIELWFTGNIHRKDTSGVIDDHTFQAIVNDLHRRYSTTINTFFSEYNDNLKSGKYMNVDKDIDEEGNYMESDNVSFMVDKATDAIMIKHSLSPYPNASIIQKACAHDDGCSINNLRNSMNYIYNNDKDFEKFIRLILQTYFFDYKRKKDDVRSLDFICVMRKHYKKQTSQDVNLNEIKTMLQKFMDESGISKKIKREPTINACKKATFTYMLYFIMLNI